jgi:predicted nuclease of predicted toxin-antitoxin system
MSSLFIRLYLDEDVNVLVADLLKARGFDTLTVRDAGQLQASDEEQLAYAVSQQRALVTHNRGDFEALIQTYFDTGQKHYGVILAVRRPPQEIAQRLLAILNQVTADEMENQVRYI